MKIMTFNVQHCAEYTTGEINFDIMAETIKKCKAEIVGINEIYGNWADRGNENQPEILANLTGLNNFYFAKAIDVNGNNAYGNALLSKYEIVNAEIIHIPDPVPDPNKSNYESRCILKAKLENSLTIMAVHFGLNEDEQQNAVKTILENMESEKCILMGDLNVEPESEILKPIREKFVDAADVFENPLMSFPSDKPNCKIDYIFVTPDIEVLKADIPAIVASDHRPHTADIEFGGIL